MKAGAWAEAADVYARALARCSPTSGLLKQNVAYLAQEWSKAAYKAGGARRGREGDEGAEARSSPGIEFAAKSGANELQAHR